MRFPLIFIVVAAWQESWVADLCYVVDLSGSAMKPILSYMFLTDSVQLRPDSGAGGFQDDF